MNFLQVWRIKMVKKMLNIAGVLYEIKMVDGDYCGGNMGKSNFAEAKIFINKDMPLQVQEMSCCTRYFIFAIETVICAKKTGKKESLKF